MQIAHMAGAGGYDDTTDQALSAFVDAIARREPHTRNLYFDATSVATFDMSQTQRLRLVQRFRQLGMERVLFGSDAISPGALTPRDWWTAFLMLPLTKSEFETIASNVAPYLR